MDHLCASEGFREQGDLASAMRADVPTILANTGSVGGHVCTWVRTSKAGYKVRTKLYNKVVSNFEAGEVREPIGGHLADYADCPNVHLRRIPMYRPGAALASKSLCTPAAGWGDLSADTAKEVVISPSDLPEEQGLCGPAARQAVGEPGLACVPRPVSCPGRPAAEVDIRCLVRAHDNRSGFGCLGPAHQGKRGQGGDLGEGRRVGRGRLRVRVAGYRRYEEKSQQARVEVEDTLYTRSGKVAETPSGRNGSSWDTDVPAQQRHRVVLRCCEATTDDDSCQATACGVWGGSLGSSTPWGVAGECCFVSTAGPWWSRRRSLCELSQGRPGGPSSSAVSSAPRPGSRAGGRVPCAAPRYRRSPRPPPRGSARRSAFPRPSRALHPRLYPATSWERRSISSAQRRCSSSCCRCSS